MKYALDNSVIAEVTDSVLELVLNRPDARNAINHPMMDSINAALDQAEADPDVSCVLIRGEGKAFSAGHDLKEPHEEHYRGSDFPDEGFPHESPGPGPLMLRAWYFPKPLICAVHGYVGAGATSIVCCADFNIAAERTRFGFEIGRGGAFAPGYWWLPLYVQLPMRVIEKLFLMGGWMDAEQAHQFQLVQRVVPQEDLIAEARRWAGQAARQQSDVFAAAKHEIRCSYEVMGLGSLHAVIARHRVPRKAAFEEMAGQEGMSAMKSARDMGIHDDVSRV